MTITDDCLLQGSGFDPKKILQNLKHVLATTRTSEMVHSDVQPTISSGRFFVPPYLAPPRTGPACSAWRREVSTSIATVRAAMPVGSILVAQQPECANVHRWKMEDGETKWSVNILFKGILLSTDRSCVSEVWLGCCWCFAGLREL